MTSADVETAVQDRFGGCLLAGAIGDALGGGVEFDSLAAIRARHGTVRQYVTAYGGRGRITDDTQMTLFTAEGLLCAAAARTDEVEAMRQAYLRWLRTQDGGSEAAPDGAQPWLLTVPALQHRRAPGNTCVSALYAGGRGTPDQRINNSKGCGGVMRVAPIGLVSSKPFATAARAAALTHGHPSGYLSAGAFAVLINQLLHGSPLRAAVVMTLSELAGWDGGQETAAALEAAVDLAERSAPTPEAVEQLGGGWVGEEALAIAVYCVLAGPDPFEALVLAVNHSGDSDSTGAITGNLLGAALGTAAVPDDLLGGLEAREVIETIAADLAAVFVDGQAPDPVRYACGSNSSETEFMQ